MIQKGRDFVNSLLGPVIKNLFIASATFCVGGEDGDSGENVRVDMI